MDHEVVDRRPQRLPDGRNVMLYRLFNAWYGQMRGYERRRIQREAWRNQLQPPRQLEQHVRVLVDKRIRQALSRFECYRDKVLQHCGRLPGDKEAIQIAELPIWTREDQRRLFAGLTGAPVPDSFKHATGGSTGVPLQFYVTRQSYEWRMAVSDRGYSWAGAEEGRPSFYVWGSPIRSPSRGENLKHRMHHWMQRREYFDSFIFDDERKALCCRAISRCKPDALVGYAGNLVELALFVRANPGLLTRRAASAVTAAEGLHQGQRELLIEFLVKDVFESYGSREFMLIGMECREHSGYHLSSDNLAVEVVDGDGVPVNHGETGRILVTDLHNDANPFIRYEIGDMGVAGAEPCPCGLPFPMLRGVEGRVQESLVRPDGTRLTALFVPHLMKEFAWIEGYQLVQNAPGDITVCVICREDFTVEMTEPVEKGFVSRMGPGSLVRFKRVAGLEKNRSGKTPTVLPKNQNKDV